MPIYTSCHRKSIVPEVYKRCSVFHKTTPFYERHKSSPNIKNKKLVPNNTKFATDSQDSKSFLARVSSRISNSKLNRDKTSSFQNVSSEMKNKQKNNANETKEKKFRFLQFVNKEKADKCTISRRQSERKFTEKLSITKQKRFTFTYRRSSTIRQREVNSITKEDKLTMLCQLLVLRTVTPKTKENLYLNETFDPNLDEHYFQYYPFVFKYLFEREQAIKFNKNYLSSNGFTESFRCTLMDWLIKVQLYSKINSETLQVAVVLIDMFTSICLIKRSFYQLVGVAGLLIACKVVQRFHPSIKELCYLTEDCYRPSHVIQMERIMLEKINFFVNVPIPIHFCHRGLLACVEIMDTDEVELFCNFLFDLLILHPESPGIRSSCKSAAAIFMARFIFHSEYQPWTKILEHYTLYRADQLKDCVLLYLDMFAKVYESKNYNYKAVFLKYSMPIKKCIAKHKSVISFVSDIEMKRKMKAYFDK